MQTKVITAHIPLPLIDKVENLAKRLERSKTWVVKQALTAWVDQEQERRQLTLEAMAEVDSGEVIDNATVQAWAQSLDSETPRPNPHQ